MCYYQLKIYMLCGHGEYSEEPIKNGLRCRIKAKAECRTPNVGSPISPISPAKWTSMRDDSQKENQDPKEEAEMDCKLKNAHPLHTYRIESLCPACNRKRWQRIAKFEVGAINEGVTRGFIKDRQKDRVEIHGKKLRTLRTGYEAGKRRSESVIGAEVNMLRNMEIVMSLDGDTLQEEAKLGKQEATSSGRNTLGTMSKLGRSTLKGSVRVAGPACAVEAERQPSISMATLDSRYLMHRLSILGEGRK